MGRCSALAAAIAMVICADGAGRAAPVYTSGSAPALNPGLEMPIQEGTQLNLGKLGVGLAYTGTDPYLDAADVRREGLHARIAVTVYGKRPLYDEPDVREGESVSLGGYRILIEKIFPGAPRGSVIVRVWHDQAAGPRP